MFNEKISHSFANSSSHLLVEKFVQENYQKSFHVSIEELFPHFLTIQNSISSQYQAVVGINKAENSSLFSEYYLQKSIEEELGVIPSYNKAINASRSRNNIVEVGNLATKSGKVFRQLIVALTVYLYTAGYEYVVFTTFPVVSNSFKRMGLKLHQLASASLEQLPPSQQQQWSQQYYNLEPKVFAGDIKQAFYTMSSNIQKSNLELQQIWNSSIQLASQLQHISTVA